MQKPPKPIIMIVKHQFRVLLVSFLELASIGLVRSVKDEAQVKQLLVFGDSVSQASGVLYSGMGHTLGLTC